MIEFIAYILVSGNITLSLLTGWVNNSGITVSAFLASGGIGFLLGVFYYLLIWWEKLPIKRLKIGADLRHILEEAESKKWLKLYCPSGCGDVHVTKLTKRGAWRVVVSYLSARAEASERIKGAIRRMDRLADLVNGLGTACLGSFLALVFFLIYNVSHGVFGQISCRGLLSLVIGLAILIFHYLNYKGVIKDYENVFAMILWNEFQLEYEKKIFSIKLPVFKNDMKEDC